jgi:hypothetical protein
MSERKRTAKGWGLRFASVIDAINRCVGVYVGWLILAMTLISPANALSHKAYGVISNPFLENQWFLFAALFVLAAGYTLQRNEHVLANIQQNVKLQPDPGDILSAALKAAHERYEEEIAANPEFRRFYQSRKDFRYAQYQRYRITEASFSNFMFGLQLPFR